MRRTLLALLLLAPACSKSAPPAPAQAEVAAVRSAYLEAWSVRDQALHTGDLSVLGTRFADVDPKDVVGNTPPGALSAYRIVSDSVTARLHANLDVGGTVDHEIQSVDLSDNGQAAQVTDKIRDATYLVDRTTKARQSSDEIVVETQIWFLVKDQGQWKVDYFAKM